MTVDRSIFLGMEAMHNESDIEMALDFRSLQLQVERDTIKKIMEMFEDLSIASPSVDEYQREFHVLSKKKLQEFQVKIEKSYQHWKNENYYPMVEAKK